MFCVSAPVCAEQFSAPPFDQAIDLHGDPAKADLVVFMAGNQFMAADALIDAFRKSDPSVRRVYFETLPPGVLARQMQSGFLKMGNLVITAKPDAFMAGRERMRKLVEARDVSAPVPYAENTLAIMVRAGDPLQIRSLADLGRPGVRVSMPNPRTEGIARQIEAAYRKAGGDDLVREIMITKVKSGTTILTSIHHRQTPARILEGRADAGPVWITEALYQERIHAPIQTIRLPAADNVTGEYEAAVVRGSRHTQAAARFVRFLESPAAQAILRSYGFETR